MKLQDKIRTKAYRTPHWIELPCNYARYPHALRGMFGNIMIEVSGNKIDSLVWLKRDYPDFSVICSGCGRTFDTSEDLG